MQNDERSEGKEQMNRINALGKPEESIFTEEEIKAIVKGFVLAWLRGDVEIRFPPPEIRFPSPTSFGMAQMNESHTKKKFINLIMICSGATQATLTERQNAVTHLFYEILAHRAAGRIEGQWQFIEYGIEERLQRLERDFEALKKRVEQLTELHERELGV